MYISFRNLIYFLGAFFAQPLVLDLVYYSIMTVSYTHLDVYKRQSLFCSNISGFLMIFESKLLIFYTLLSTVFIIWYMSVLNTKPLIRLSLIHILSYHLYWSKTPSGKRQDMRLHSWEKCLKVLTSYKDISVSNNKLNWFVAWIPVSYTHLCYFPYNRGCSKYRSWFTFHSGI